MAVEGDPSQADYLFRLRDPRLVVSYLPGREGKARAYNRILPLLEGAPIVFLVSADVTLQAEIFAEVLRLFEDPQMGVVVPRVQPSPTGTLAGGVGKLLWDLHDLQLSALSDGSRNVHGGEFVAIRGELLVPFPEDLINDDAYLCVHAIKQGFRLHYARGVVVRNEVPRTLKELFNQRRRVSYGHWQLSHMGYRPAILTHMLTDDLRAALRILTRSVRTYPEDLPYMPVLLLEESYAVLLSRGDRKGEIDHTKWTMVPRVTSPDSRTEAVPPGTSHPRTR